MIEEELIDPILEFVIFLYEVLIREYTPKISNKDVILKWPRLIMKILKVNVLFAFPSPVSVRRGMNI